MDTRRLEIEVLDGARLLGRLPVSAEVATGPFCVGREGQVVIPGSDVLPVHGVLLFEGGRLFAASASADSPLRIGNESIPTDWVEIPLPSIVRVGARISLRVIPAALGSGAHPSLAQASKPVQLPSAPRQTSRPSVSKSPLGTMRASRSTPLPTGPHALPPPIEPSHARDATVVGPVKSRAVVAVRPQPQPQEMTGALPVRPQVEAPAQARSPRNADTAPAARGAPRRAATATGDDTLLKKATRHVAADWRRTSILGKVAVAVVPVVAILLMTKPSSGAAHNDAATKPYAASLPADAPFDPSLVDPASAMRAPGSAPAEAPTSTAAAVPSTPTVTVTPFSQPNLSAPQPSTLGAQPGFGTSTGKASLLTPAERHARKRAVDFTFAGDYPAALAMYTMLAAAHPEDIELRTAMQVIAAKAQRR